MLNKLILSLACFTMGPYVVAMDSLSNRYQQLERKITVKVEDKTEECAYESIMLSRTLRALITHEQAVIEINPLIPKEIWTKIKELIDIIVMMSGVPDTVRELNKKRTLQRLASYPRDTFKTMLSIINYLDIEELLPLAIEVAKKEYRLGTMVATLPPAGDLENLREFFIDFRPYIFAISLPTMAWLLGHMLCHDCMEYIEPSGQTSIFLAALIGTLLYVNYKYDCGRIASLALLGKLYGIKTQKPLLHLLANLDDTLVPLLGSHFTQPNLQPLFEDFLLSLSKAHIAELEDIHEILHLFRNPFRYAATHRRFMATICKAVTLADQGNLKERIRILATLMQETPCAKKIFFTNSSFIELKKCFKAEHLAQLSDPKIIEIAEFCPHILTSQRIIYAILADKTMADQWQKALKEADQNESRLQRLQETCRQQ